MTNCNLLKMPLVKPFFKKNKRILSKIIPSNHLLVTKMAFGIVIIV